MAVPVSPCVEVAGVVLIFKFGDEVGLHPQQAGPVDGDSCTFVAKIFVLLHLASTSRAKSVQGVLLQKSCNNSLGFSLDRPVLLLGPLNVIVDCVSKELLGGFPKERNTTDEKLVENDSHAPPIHRLAIPLSENHLRSNIFRRPKHLLVRKLLCLLVNVSLVQIGRQGHQSHLAQAEVGELDVPEGSDEEVVWLEISVDNSKAVQILNCKDSLGKIEPAMQRFYI